MYENRDLVAVLTVDDLADLISLAKMSPPYIKGHSWATHAIREAINASVNAQIRYGMRDRDAEEGNWP